MGIALLLMFLVTTVHSCLGEDIDCSRGPTALCMDPSSQFNLLSEIINADSKTEALTRLCPTVTTYLNCTVKYAQICLSDREQEQVSGFYGLTLDICDPNTSLHREFVNNAECLFKQERAAISCRQQAAEQEETYRDYYVSVEGKENELQVAKEASCLNGYMMVGCLSNKVEQKCGHEAAYIVMQVAIRSKQLCTKEEGMTVQRKLSAIPT